TPHELIALALRTILHQTTAKVAGYLSLDPEDPAPKVVMPETAAVDIPLSKRLTTQAQQNGKTIWLFPDLTASHPPTDSLSAFAAPRSPPLRRPGPGSPFSRGPPPGRPSPERPLGSTGPTPGSRPPGLKTPPTRRTLEAENYRLRSHTPAADDILG